MNSKDWTLEYFYKYYLNELKKGNIDEEALKLAVLNKLNEQIARYLPVYAPKEIHVMVPLLQKELGSCPYFSTSELRRIVNKADADRHVKETNALIAKGHSPIDDERTDGGVYDETPLTSVVTALENKIKSWGNSPRVDLGIGALDRCAGGLYPGELMVLVGAPGSMKTSLALKAVSEYVSSKPQGKVLFVSADMPRETIGQRMIHHEQLDDVTDQELKEMIRLNDAKYIAARQSMIEKYEGRLAIIGHKIRNRVDINKMLLEVKRRGSDFVVIDYLTVLKGQGVDDFKFVDSAMLEIQALAQEMDIPILLLSQMSRASRAAQATGSMGGHSRGGGKVEEITDVEIELMKEQTEEGAPLIVATVTKTRRGLAGKSFILDYRPCSMRFTGLSIQAERVTPKKAIYQPKVEGY